DVVAHLVAADAEGLGIGRLEGRVEAAPEDDAGDEADDGEEAEAEEAARPPQHGPVAAQELQELAHDAGSAVAWRLGGRALAAAVEQLVDVDEAVLDQRLLRNLRHV